MTVLVAGATGTLGRAVAARLGGPSGRRDFRLLDPSGYYVRLTSSG